MGGGWKVIWLSWVVSVGWLGVLFRSGVQVGCVV